VKRDYPNDAWRAAWVKNVRGECLLRTGKTAEGRRLIAASTSEILKTWPANTLFAAEARGACSCAADEAQHSNLLLD